jgi:hypothetical protein
MNARDGYRMLMSVEFGRTEVYNATIPLRVDYVFAKMTPFGVLEARGFVSYEGFLSTGAERMDARMLDTLSKEVNREEMARYTETSANVECCSSRTVAA